MWYFSIVETHLSDNSEFRPNVEKYIFEGFNRSFTHVNAPGTWGGVGFLIKKDLLNYYNYKIIEKTFDGVFSIELTHHTTGKKILLVSGYLPPENSPYGRDSDGFFAHLDTLQNTSTPEPLS